MTITAMEVLLGHAEFILIIWCGVLAFESNHLKRRYIFWTKPKYLQPYRNVKGDVITVVKNDTRIYS